jgi:hypothetical protein
MEVKLPPIAPPEPDDFDNLPFLDLDNVDLWRLHPQGPYRQGRLSRLISARKSNPPKVRQGVAEKSGTKAIVRIMHLALVNPPRAVDLKLPPIASPDLDDFDDLPFLDGCRPGGGCAPKPGFRKTDAKASVKTVRLRAVRSLRPPTSGNKVTFPVRRSPLPPTPPSGHRIGLRCRTLMTWEGKPSHGPRPAGSTFEADLERRGASTSSS